MFSHARLWSLLFAFLLLGVLSVATPFADSASLEALRTPRALVSRAKFCTSNCQDVAVKDILNNFKSKVDTTLSQMNTKKDPTHAIQQMTSYAQEAKQQILALGDQPLISAGAAPGLIGLILDIEGAIFAVLVKFPLGAIANIIKGTPLSPLIPLIGLLELILSLIPGFNGNIGFRSLAKLASLLE